MLEINRWLGEVESRFIHSSGTAQTRGLTKQSWLLGADERLAEAILHGEAAGAPLSELGGRPIQDDFFSGDSIGYIHEAFRKGIF